MQPVLIAGQWRPASASRTFQVDNPAEMQPLPDVFPVSDWHDCDAALAAAADAAVQLRAIPAEKIADFLGRFAARFEARKVELVASANAETALPASPRLADVELPRTTSQLRQAAAAVREGSWSLPTIDTQANIRSVLAPIGPVCVFGPNNFPFAFNSVAGGDFAAAIAAGNPVIAKANSSHPGTTRLLAEEAFAAVQEAGLPLATVQLIYRTGHEDGERLVADPRIGATAYTGSRSAGLKLKAAADVAGKPIYLELSSINPVVILPGAISERGNDLVSQFTSSCLMGAGQFCTNPGLVVLLESEQTESFIQRLKLSFQEAPIGTLLSKAVSEALSRGVSELNWAGAEMLAGGSSGGGRGYSHSNTLLRVGGKQFLANHQALQTEAFGNASLIVVAADIDEARAVLEALEGNLTGCIYTHSGGDDDSAYAVLADVLRQKVGRLINDKMPTGVAVSAAMNHGGPYPATGHPGFTAVGIPASLRRFGMLQCYDNVREDRLPPVLRNANVTGKTWRLIDGAWTQAGVQK